MSTATTEGIRIVVRSAYLPDQSAPRAKRYAFAYTVSIVNESLVVVQLRSRHWIITDNNGHIDEVRGEGVVGQQPTLKPNQSFEYTSGCILTTSQGTMRGTYRMVCADGREFDATIAPFLLSMPHTLN